MEKPINRFKNNKFHNAVFLLFALFAGSISQAQTDLTVQFTGNLPTSVQVGSYFAIQGQVIFDVNETNPIPAGETIKAVVEFRDPNGIIIASHTQTWDGFQEAGNAPTLSNNRPNSEEVRFLVPWSEASKWTPTALWQVSARVESSPQEIDPTNNQVSHQFTLEIPNLEMTAVDATGSFFQNSNISVSATVTNNGTVMTQNGVFFPVEARLFQGTLTGTGPISGNILDSERVIIPFANQGVDPFILSGDSVAVQFPSLRIPPGASGDFTIQVIADPTDLNPLGSIIQETEEDADNHLLFNFTVVEGTPNLQINPQSFSGETGTFRGLEPIRISFAVSNQSNFPVEPGDTFTAQVLLSEDDSTSNTDYILREFDLSGDALGANLLPNEHIILDWIQQLPDNLEGDYYLLVHILETDQSFPLTTTPVITLTSENKGSMHLIAPTFPRNTERPHVSEDGNWFVYEETDANGIQQIYVRNRLAETGAPVPQSILVTRSFENRFLGANGNSLRPKISADGSTVVFHSRASDLVPSDENGVEDIFVYSVFEDKIFRLRDFSSGGEANGGSSYADLNRDGTVIVFESKATNIHTTGVNSIGGRQIYLWDRSVGSSGMVRLVTNGNAQSQKPSINHDGNLIAFASDATNLVTEGDSNSLRDIFLFNTDSNVTTLLTKNFIGAQTIGGASDQPEISGNGEYVVFRSSATNLIQAAGISKVLVSSGGAGYMGNPTITISDSGGAGEGALLEFSSDGIDIYGQIKPNGINVLSPGFNYQNPTITIVPDPTQPPPIQQANVSAVLAHPDGEIYRVEVDNPAGSIIRVSQNANNVGGDMESRDASISTDGKSIVFSTMSSNLLDENITRDDGSVFYNLPTSQALAEATILGGIGEIEVANGGSGSGYQNGFLTITDLSGNGSGASASYEVDAFGRISSITVITSGNNYDLANTVVNVDNPRGGTGFQAGTLRFVQETGFGNTRSGGGRVHQVRMTNHGSGYYNWNSASNPLIKIEGDGVDSDNDGYTDAKINTDLIRIDSKGAIYLIQSYDVTVLSTGSLIGTTLTVSDANRTIDIAFAVNDSPPFTIGLARNTGGFRTVSEIRDRIIDIVRTEWSNPAIGQYMEGPQIDNNVTNGNSFTLSGLSGMVSTSSAASLQVSPQSNMLFSGAGFTRATPVVAPPPVIHGFSEVASGTSTVTSPNGRPVLSVSADIFTDDIYLFEDLGVDGLGNDIFRTERISRSTFGFPVNYLPSQSTSMPSNRFASISGDGRHVYFSSDAAGSGGLAFTNTNQSPNDTNTARDIYYFDRKTSSQPDSTVNVEILFPNNSLNHSFGPNTQVPIVVQLDGPLSNTANSVDLYVNGERQFFTFLQEYLGSSYSSNRFTGIYSAPANGTHIIEVLVTDINGQIIGSSERVQLSISSFSGSLVPNVFLSEPIFNEITSTSTIAFHSTGSDPDGNFLGIQYYINGVALGNEILRPSTSSPESFGYVRSWTPQNPGIYSVVAVGRDNSGNFVTSDVYNISVTTGSEGANISPIKPFTVVELNSSNSDIQFGTGGEITSVSILDPNGLGFGYFSNPRIDVVGTGSNASITPVVDMNITSPSYGKVVDFIVSNGGSGYASSSTQIRIIPVIQSVKIGEEAQVSTAYDRNQSGDIIATNYFVPQRYDGTLLTGSGYVTAPRFFPSTRLTPPRLPLSPPLPGESSTSILDFSATLQAPPIYPIGVVTGGFNHSPVFIEFNASHSRGNITEVYLMVNGFLEATLNTKPYAFSLLLDNPQEYSIIGYARDEFGNVTSSEPLTVDLREFSGSAPAAQFLGNQVESVQVGSSLILTSLASSENGINNVEYYLDNKSLGFAQRQNESNFYSSIINLSELSEGPHQLSLIARDNYGNQVGTFNESLTNILPKINKTIRVRSSSNPIMPFTNILAPRTENLPGFQADDMTVYEQGSIVNLLLEAYAPGVGEVSEIMIYSNGVPVSYVGPNAVQSSLIHDPNSVSHQIGRYEFSFEANSTGVKTLVPVVVDTFGNHYVSQDSISINIKERLGSSPPQIRLVSPYKGEMGQVWQSGEQDIDQYRVQEISRITLNSTIPVVAFAEDEDKDFEGLQFFVNGTPISAEKKLPLKTFYPDQYPYSMVWEANETGVFYFYAMGSDKSGNISISNLSTIQVNERFDNVPDVPFFTGSRRLADINTILENNGSISVQITDPGYGYFSAPTVSIEAINHTGVVAEARAILDPLSKSISEVQMINAGTGYTSPPVIHLDGGFIDSVATGAHASGTVVGARWKYYWSNPYQSGIWIFLTPHCECDTSDG